MLGILKEAGIGKAEKFGYGDREIGCLAPCHSTHFFNYTISKVGHILSLNAKVCDICQNLLCLNVPLSFIHVCFEF